MSRPLRPRDLSHTTALATSNLYGQTQEQLDAADAQIANSFSFHQTTEGNWETDSDTEQNAEASTAAAPRADDQPTATPTPPQSDGGDERPSETTEPRTPPRTRHDDTNFTNRATAEVHDEVMG